ncbi:hypothetical protein LTR66_010990 [Elasticomyces elasticus]|nr:hypothetical protein LTR66_010990 [Elasticomyces elasticus]KAK5010034.1 hypothetical protein LTR28_012112 [Elasticomyces elasticus]
MAPEGPVDVPDTADADFVKAFQYLARAEQTAATMENNLSVLEAKIEALLAQADENERNIRCAKVEAASLAALSAANSTEETAPRKDD